MTLLHHGLINFFEKYPSIFGLTTFVLGILIPYTIQEINRYKSDRRKYDLLKKYIALESQSIKEYLAWTYDVKQHLTSSLKTNFPQPRHYIFHDALFRTFELSDLHRFLERKEVINRNNISFTSLIESQSAFETFRKVFELNLDLYRDRILETNSEVKGPIDSIVNMLYTEVEASEAVEMFNKISQQQLVDFTSEQVFKIFSANHKFKQLTETNNSLKDPILSNLGRVINKIRALENERDSLIQSFSSIDKIHAKLHKSGVFQVNQPREKTE